MAQPLLRRHLAKVYNHAVTPALKNENVSRIYRNARICITPAGQPYVKVVQNGETIDKLHIEIIDRANTYKALCVIKDSFKYDKLTS